MYVLLYEHSSQENDDNNLCGNHVSVSEQAKDRKDLVIKNQKYSQIRVFALTAEYSMVGLKNWL